MEAKGQEGSLRSYLWKHFPPHLWTESKLQADSTSREDGGSRWTDTEMMHHFFTQYGVNIFIEASIFYLFKYEMTIADNWKDEIREARGIIFRREGEGGWEVVSRPFDKFFNQQESECPISDKREFEARCREFSFVEKADGTCVQFWWCPPPIIEEVVQYLTIKEQKELERKKERLEREKEALAIEAQHQGSDPAAVGSGDKEEEGAEKEDGDDEKQSSKLEKRNRRFQQMEKKKEAAPLEEVDVRDVVRKPRNHNVHYSFPPPPKPLQPQNLCALSITEGYPFNIFRDGESPR